MITVVVCMELDTVFGVSVEDVLIVSWLCAGDEAAGGASWLEVVVGEGRLEDGVDGCGKLVESGRLTALEDEVRMAVLDGVLLTWMLVVNAVGTEVATQEQAAETRLTRSSFLSVPQSSRYLGISWGSVIVPPSHLEQSVAAALRFLLSIMVL